MQLLKILSLDVTVCHWRIECARYIHGEGMAEHDFFGPLDHEDEGTTIIRNVGNYLPADLDIQ